jgi:hypothetical protein
MAKYISLFLVFFSLNLFAQSYAQNIEQNIDQFIPTADQCYKSASQLELYPEIALVIRLAKFDFSRSSRVYLDTWLCSEKDTDKDCVHIKKSKIAQNKVPLSLGIASKDIGCLLVYGEHHKKSYQYLVIQIIDHGRIFDSPISTSYVKINTLKNFNTLKTTDSGVLLTFPVSMN